MAMTLIRSIKDHLKESNRPQWCTATSAGVWTLKRDTWFDCHYHECNEYWLIYKGKAKATSGGQQYYMQAGDILCIKAGDDHDILEIYEDIEAFWFEDTNPPGAGVGHLHRTQAQAKG